MANMHTSHWQVRASRASICPIHTLPDDILRSIFDHCEASSFRYYDFATTRDTIQTKDIQWILSYVCRHWRAIVLASPLLWSVIRLDIDLYNTYPASAVEAYPFLLELSLQRSRNVDLRLMIADTLSPEFVVERRIDFIETLIPILLSSTSRWRCLDLFGFSDIMGAFAARSFERLRTLNVFLWEENEDCERQLNVFRDVPSLKSLTLDSWRRFEPQLGGTRGIECPWSSVRDFTTLIDGLIRLPDMPQLEELYVKWNSFEKEEVLDELASELQSLSPFVLPQLHTITIYHLPTNDKFIHELSRKLSAPALKTLKLSLRNLNCRTDPHPSLSWFPDFDTLDNVINLSINSDEHIDSPENARRRPRTSSEQMNDVDLIIAFLSRTLSVTTLFLGSKVDAPAVLEAIGGGLLPHLATLCLHLPFARKDVEPVISMLEQRALCPVASPITEVRFSISDVFCPWDDYSPVSTWTLVESIVQGTDLMDRWAVLCEIIDIRYVGKNDF